jgi:predicted ATP-grasp superfamily ATP-dependent carboligase
MERAVLIPCSDALTEAVAALPAELRNRFPASVPDLPVLEQLVDKAGLAGLLREHDVAGPATLVIAGPGTFDDQSADGLTKSLRDAFVKPRDSQRFFARYGVKAFRPSEECDVRALVEKATLDGFEVIVQEYVPGPASNHYFIDGFMDRAGEVKGVFARQRLRMYPPWFGNSSAVRSVDRSETSSAEEALLRLLRAIGYRGIFSAEFKRDERDGTFRLLEINARAWWYVEFATRAGVDVVSMAYDDALGRPVERVDDYQVGRTLVYPYYDLFACLEARRVEGASLFRGLASWLGADHTVFAWDDPKPFLADSSRTALRFAARRLDGRSTRRAGPEVPPGP